MGAMQGWVIVLGGGPGVCLLVLSSARARGLARSQCERIRSLSLLSRRDVVVASTLACWRPCGLNFVAVGVKWVSCVGGFGASNGVAATGDGGGVFLLVCR